MADKTELRMNLAAIKRVDPYAKDIIDSSAHVAFYTFNPDETEWEKTDVEGAFFVYARNAEPFHSIFINNRLNTNSLVEPITAHIELQSQPPFLLYRNERSRIRGFWFYDRSECDRIGELVERIVKDTPPSGQNKIAGANNVSLSTATTSAPSIPTSTTTTPSTTKVAPKATVVAAPVTSKVIGGSGPSKPIDMNRYSSSNVDIFSMLSKAQQDFNNSLVTPGGPAGKNAIMQHGPAQLGPAQMLAAHVISNGGDGKPSDKNVPRAVPIAVPPKTVADGTSQSVMNFFAAAKPASKPAEAPFLQRMVSHPVRVDQIEKQQRATPHNDKHSPPQPTATQKPSDIENGFGFMRIHSPIQQQADLGTSPLATFIGAANNNAANVQDSNKHDSKEPLQELLKKPAPTLAAALVNATNTTPHKPALMPPTMFKSTSNSVPATVTSNANKSTPNASNAATAKNTNTTINSNSGTNSNTHAAATNNLHSSSNQIKKESMTTPNANIKIQKRNAAGHQLDPVGGVAAGGGGNNSNAIRQPIITKPEPLTQTQLLQAMSYLIKNDPDFVRKIHEAYLKSFTEMVSL